MVIDILSYTPEQFAALSGKKLQKIREAQKKKNQLEEEWREKVKKEREKRLQNNTYLTSVFALFEANAEQEYNDAVEQLRDDLNFTLHYLVKVEKNDRVPYPLDESLSPSERYKVVKNYYDKTYANPITLFEAFKADLVAKEYLGDLYATLYDYYAARA